MELLLFNTQAPVNAVLLDCVSTNLRNFSMSYNVLIIHLLGVASHPTPNTPKPDSPLLTRRVHFFLWRSTCSDIL